ncbi:MAG: zinc-dependent alcohol dehydrogenase family protein [Anaerolineales bacterium]|jgi:propanol-preferring alcohol dehydrogenase
MKAMVIHQITDVKENPNPLHLVEMPIPTPRDNELLLKVSACGVCHTELDEIEGRTPPPHFPIVPGHQVVGEVVDKGESAKDFHIGDRVGVAWVYSSCGVCSYCRSGFENLCPDFKATGRDSNGGYGEYMIVPELSAFAIPEVFSSAEAAPLLCAGAIGYRSLMLTNHRDGERLGLTGFGASGHLVLKMIGHRYPNSLVYVFARSPKERGFALDLGAVWAGDTTDAAPEKLDSIIDTTPVWKPVVEALKNLYPAGRLVINAIRKEDIDKDYLLKLDYTTHLWMEKEIKSVANVTRQDVREFLDLAAEIPIRPEINEYGLQEANQALYELKTQKIRGAKVLRL